MRSVVSIAALYVLCLSGVSAQCETGTSRAWQAGWLHIHHISTGRGDSALAIMPDGSTLLIDAGDLDPLHAAALAPLVPATAKPNDGTSPASAIANYLQRLGVGSLDYALITHFDPDHYGRIVPSAQGPMLSGIAELDSQVPIGILIDRAYPDYAFPKDLVEAHRVSRPEFLLYRKYVRGRDAARRKTERLKAGSASQIVLLHDPEAYPEFSIRNIKANNLLWTGQQDDARELFSSDDMLNASIGIRENPLSLAIVIRYGTFEYFTGGDLTGDPGYNKPDWFDVESPVADVVGEVDVSTLNHHGNRSSVNANFLRNLQPRVMIQQSWISDHPGSEVVRRMADRAIYPGDREVFATYVHESSKQTIGRKMVQLYRSYSGHIVVRVSPGGAQYWVDVIDDSDSANGRTETFGPYQARNEAMPIRKNSRINGKQP